jgi:Holliday junction DNA helicase RuvA
MIAKLTGLVDTLLDHSVILDVQGVGYLLHCSTFSLKALREAEGPCSLHVEMVVREELMQLYGFWTHEEKDLFKVLLNVQGVGMKVALALLSIAEPEHIVHAIASGDHLFLNKADGVGPKLASRLVNELKDKVRGLTKISAVETRHGVNASEQAHLIEDAVSILRNLGYRPSDAEQAVRASLRTLPESVSVEEVIKVSLSKLSRI